VGDTVIGTTELKALSVVTECLVRIGRWRRVKIPSAPKRCDSGVRDELHLPMIVIPGETARKSLHHSRIYLASLQRTVRVTACIPELVEAGFNHTFDVRSEVLDLLAGH